MDEQRRFLLQPIPDRALDTGVTNSNHVNESVARVIESNEQACQHGYITILSVFNDAARKSNGEITVQLIMEDVMLKTTFLPYIISTKLLDDLILTL